MIPKSVHPKLLNWYYSRSRQLPWRDLWKLHRDPWHIWVSEIMLQQTVIKAVLPVYEKFIKQYPSPKALANATTEEVRLAVRGLGYYRRFDALHRAAIEITQKHSRQMPKSYNQWIELPGIGDYTASAIASITLDEPQGVVDGNVERVMCRLLDIRQPPNSPRLKKEFKVIMNDLVKLGSPGDFNQAVMELGQILCTPTNPSCKLCPISTSCKAFKLKSQSLAPAPKSKKLLVDIDLALLVARDSKNNIGLVHRPTTAKFLKKTSGFPTFILNKQKEWESDGLPLPKGLLETVHAELTTGKRRPKTFRHNITHHRIRAHIVEIKTKYSKFFDSFIPMNQIEELLVSNLDRKALHKLSN